MKTDDRRKRPWKKLRVIVEVSVPPTSRLSESHLSRALLSELPSSLLMSNGAASRLTPLRVKVFSTFWPAFLRKEKGLPINFNRPKKQPVADENRGL